MSARGLKGGVIAREVAVAAAQAALAAGVVLAVTLGLLTAAGRAGAHEWYDPYCCSDQDCAPLDDGAVIEGPAGYEIPSTGETIPYRDDRVRPSADGRFHRCALPGTPGHTRCLYVPPGGV